MSKHRHSDTSGIGTSHCRTMFLIEKSWRIWRHQNLTKIMRTKNNNDAKWSSAHVCVSNGEIPMKIMMSKALTNQMGRTSNFQTNELVYYTFPPFLFLSQTSWKRSFRYFMAKESEKRRNVGKNGVVRITKCWYCKIRQSWWFFVHGARVHG